MMKPSHPFVKKDTVELLNNAVDKLFSKYLAPLNNEINDKKDVIQIPMRPGTTSGGINTDAAEARQSIILGMNVCNQ